MDYAAARETMIDSQVRTNDVSDLALQAALRAVPREVFVPEPKRPFAYAEMEIAVTEGRALWTPRDVSKLLQAADLRAGERAVVIGGATGYAAALLVQLGLEVTVLEETDALVAHSREVLAAAGTSNVAVVEGNLKTGLPGPFDFILVDGAVETVPDAWAAALADGGRMAVVVQQGPVGKARLYTRAGDAVGFRVVFDAAAPMLPGFALERGFAF